MKSCSLYTQFNSPYDLFPNSLSAAVSNSHPLIPAVSVRTLYPYQICFDSNLLACSLSLLPAWSLPFCLMIFMLMALLTLAIFSLFPHCFQTQAVFGLSHLAAFADTHGFMS
ncbi:uncharacterized protein BO87DRAFT_170201 [Aspergillus neoniger CBS 115656]|uniref:Uncharacterized protein n=1 Tax=Aspergillus neoniger (strain CBS 115656) TaxID=1448310 RepID=A0A318Y6Q4_ASPNB|nr:hypothetical protein BO87DRAFT_170201 [Aspergillus neoniger CBS 115656]PYH29995.1 hypothetical protein BO87DRAFT_170201 [Aspergillus neoniger CBS 115656]